MARKYTRDARGRFASGGFSGQTGGRGARLMAKGTRAGGGARMKAAPPAGSFRRGQVKPPAKPVETTASRASSRIRAARGRSSTVARPAGFQARPVSPSRMKMSDQQGVLGKVAQRRSMRAIAATAREDAMSRGVIKRPHRNQTTKAGRVQGTVKMNEGQKTRHYVIAAGQRNAARAQSRAMREAGPLTRRPPDVTPTTVMPRAGEGARPPKISEVLRGNLRALAQSDARFYRELERDFGIKIPNPTASRAKTLPPPPGGQSGARSGKVSTALREGLRSLAQADARRLRDIAAITREAPAGTLRGSGSRPRLAGSKPRLGPGKRRKG